MTAVKTFTITERETDKEIYLEVSLHSPSITDIKEAVEQIRSHSRFKNGEKFQVSFSEVVRVQRDRRNNIETDEIKVKFFESSSGRFAYTFHHRSGYPVSYLDYQKVEKISYRVANDTEKERLELAEKILNRRFDEKTWSHLTPEGVKDLALTVVSIKSKFPNYVIEELKDAFENKKDYSYHKYGSKRDLSVSTKLDKDGIFRAWFSSEYSGCGNGQYYLLLNPTTASFCEWD